MTATASDWIHEIRRLLGERGYEPLPLSIGSAVSMTRRGHSLGPFLPFTDYIFVHECTCDTSAAELSRLHEASRTFADSNFRLPKILRYRIPNAVTIGVSGNGFSPEAVAFAETSTLRSPLLGGEKDSKYLFDVVDQELHSQGLEATPGRYGSSNVVMTNPTNRTYTLMVGVLEGLSHA